VVTQLGKPMRIKCARIADKRELPTRKIVHQRRDLADLLLFRGVFANDDVLQISDEVRQVEQTGPQAFHVKSAYRKIALFDKELVQQSKKLPRASGYVMEGNISQTPVAVPHPLNGDVLPKKRIPQDNCLPRWNLADLDRVVDVGDDRF